MEILPYNSREQLLGYIPRVKASLKEWQLIEVRLPEGDAIVFTIEEVARMLQAMFPQKQGIIYICNTREMFGLLHWGKANDPGTAAKTIKNELPEGCEVNVHEASPAGFMKIELLLSRQKTADSPSGRMRLKRKENIILVADDDMYMRMLVKKGMPSHITVYEVANGNDVVEHYKKYLPDVLFLDIHLPGKDGTEILKEILSLDKDAYVIMLSADSSRENVEHASRLGTKDFLTKPFTKDRLLECVNKCPTIS